MLERICGTGVDVLTRSNGLKSSNESSAKVHVLDGKVCCDTYEYAWRISWNDPTKVAGKMKAIIDVVFLICGSVQGANM